MLKKVFRFLFSVCLIGTWDRDEPLSRSKVRKDTYGGNLLPKRSRQCL